MSTLTPTETLRNTLYHEIDTKISGLPGPERAPAIAEWLKSELDRRIGVSLGTLSPALIGRWTDVLDGIDRDDSIVNQRTMIRSRLYILVNERLEEYAEVQRSRMQRVTPAELDKNKEAEDDRRTRKTQRWRATMIRKGLLKEPALTDS